MEWGISFQFIVKNGVRQGAVSSPILFGIYVDKLIKMLRKSKLGCSIGRHYLGIMVYADDVILLSPSRMGLQAIMKICQRLIVSSPALTLSQQSKRQSAFIFVRRILILLK